MEKDQPEKEPDQKPDPTPDQKTDPELDQKKQNPYRETGFDALMMGKVQPKFPSWMKALPFFLSGFFFLSSFFTIFSPLPLLIYSLKVETKKLAIAVATNAVLIVLLAGLPSGLTYLCSTGVLVLSLPYFFFGQRQSVDRAVVMTLLNMAVAAIVFSLIFGLAKGSNPVTLLKNEISASVDQILKISQSGQGLTPLLIEELKENLMMIFPSMIAIFALIMVWANLLLLIRLNPVYIQKVLGKDLSFVSQWRAPDFMVWPTIAMGALLIFDIGWPSVVASNIFRVLMAVYAIQGLSILAALFDTWRIQGFFRTLGYILAVWPFTPMLLALGFFDLWFDFRAKFRQSTS